MQTILKNLPDERLKAYFIWLPVLPTDNRNWAVKRMKELSDHRVRHLWDGDQLMGKIWLPVLGLEGPLSWDTYLLYDHKTRWTNQPTVPSYWMHQLGYAENFQGLLLDVPMFERKARELLEQIRR